MQKGRRHNRQLHNRPGRPNVALRLAAVLLIMVCISTWMMDGLFAKYRTSDSGGDNARVIGFGNLTLTEEGDFGTAGGQGYFAPGMNLKKQATVTFTGSESATYVFMEVTLSEHWKTEDDGKTFFIKDENATENATEKQLEWAVAAGWTLLPEPANENKNSYVYYRALSPNKKLTDAKFFANMGNDVNEWNVTVSPSIKRADMAALNGITINLRASVVQSNGFSGPKQAWDSISRKSSN